MIGFQIRIKISKAPNMMNVEAASDVFLGAPAILTGIPITLSGSPFLRSPIRAIIAIIATAPCRIARAAIAHISAFLGTEAALTGGGHFPLWDRNFFVARLTDENCRWFAEGAGSLFRRFAPTFPALFGDIVRLEHFTLDNAESASTVEALARANGRIFGITQAAWIRLKGLAANRANQFYHVLIITQFGFMSKKGGIHCA